MTSLARTGRWRGVATLSLFAGAVGLLAQRPEVLMLATVGVGYAVYPRLVPSPPEPDLAVERSITPASPAPGDRVAVSVTVRNEGDRWLPDLRIVDGVPSLLPVVDGTPRRATALGPGDETTLDYVLEAREGKHRFEATTVLSRDLGGATERRTAVTEATVVDCGAAVSSTSLRKLTSSRAGSLRTDTGGSGIEFHRAREYRRGDPMRQVDWRRFARGGELATIEFREERAAAVLLCVDGGVPAANQSASGTAHAVARSVGAADRLAGALVGENHEVGLAALGARFHWSPPKLGKDHLAQLRHTLDTDAAFVPASTAGGSGPLGTGDGEDGSDDAGAVTSDAPDQSHADGEAGPGGPSVEADGAAQSPALSDGGRPTGSALPIRERQTAELRERLGSNTQLTVLTPLADDAIVESIRTLEAAGHHPIVVSPDATTADTLGNRLAATERATRVRSLRRTGVPVVDWTAGDHLGNAIEATMERYR